MQIHYYLELWGTPPPAPAMKRKRWTGWRFFVAGEWSQGPYHEGKVTFDYSFTDDRRFWAVKFRAFPSRIVAVAEALPDQSTEEILGLMLKGIRENNGPYIDYVYSAQEEDLDFDKVMEISMSR